MPIRNPFAKRVDPPPHGIAEENASNATRPPFEKLDTTSSMVSLPLSVGSKQSQEPPEYKMSVVNDSGVYLPPSPPEKKGIWPRRSNVSRTSTSTRHSEDIEPFSISRESFDSYRRSFDISARSPIVQGDGGRQSLDSARMPRLPRSAINERHFEKPQPTAEEGFEDVGLNDEPKQPQKKKGFFTRFGDSSSSDTPASSTPSRFHIGGRKRGQSGVGEELGAIQRPGTPGKSEGQEMK